jgi:hypothetical protein
MLTYEKLSRRPESFRRLTGVDIDLFNDMTEKIRPLWGERRNNFGKGGRKHNLSGVENHLLAMLLYYRCYVTYEFLGFFFDSDETTVMRSVKRIERIAVRVVHIEKKRDIGKEDAEYLIIDATEQPVQRPKRGQKKHYSGKKRKHTLGTQFIVGPDRQIFSVSKSYPGSFHDFRIYKEQKGRYRFHGLPKKADGGYQGIAEYDRLAEIPFRKPRNGELTAEQKAYNRNLSKKRIIVEHVIREVKVFKIMSETYRNRLKGHNIKKNIISGIVNMKIAERKMRQTV